MALAFATRWIPATNAGITKSGDKSLATACDRLIVALDFPDIDAARGFVKRVGPAVGFYKIGLELAMAGGLELARQLVGEGKRVFLDMKLLDIENTVERATRNAAATGASFLTVHAHDAKTVRAAIAGRAGTQLSILGVTVLTNLDAADLAEQGIAASPQELVLRRVALARRAGCEGVIASGHEAAAVRAVTGSPFLIVTPAIRLPGDAVGDQARAATPQTAIAAGADYLVVGRPITAAPDPARAVEVFVAAIEEALGKCALASSR
jgi:orotidine-5'-phosphate decarboxylase